MSKIRPHQVRFQMKYIQRHKFYSILAVKAGILRVHPDLAGRIAQAGQLTQESNKEQSAADLNLLTDYEHEIMTSLNKRYKQKFGFPFVICARLNKKEAILNGLELRCQNDPQTELDTGIQEVLKICELRVRDIISDQLSVSRL